jgi:hypothetical protein
MTYSVNYITPMTLLRECARQSFKLLADTSTELEYEYIVRVENS